MQRALQYQGPGWTDAPIGIQNGGNIRTSISNEGNGELPSGFHATAAC